MTNYHFISIPVIHPPFTFVLPLPFTLSLFYFILIGNVLVCTIRLTYAYFKKHVERWPLVSVSLGWQCDQVAKAYITFNSFIMLVWCSSSAVHQRALAKELVENWKSI